MTEELRILLVEDNPGDARLIEEMLRDPESFAGQFDRQADGALSLALETEAESVPVVTHVSTLAAGVERLEEGTDEPDVVLLDLNLPDNEGLTTLDTVLEHVDAVPVIVLTGLRDRETGVRALRRGAHEYLVKDEINSDLLARSLYHAIEREAYERELKEQRERLAALDQLNAAVRDVTRTIVEQSSRESIERGVCEQLADSESYRFAWIAEIDPATQEVSARTEAGVDGYLDGVALSIGEGSPNAGTLTSRAVQTHETQVANDILADSEFEEWHDHARKHGFRSVAVIPITHEGLLYGTLNVHSERPGAFGGEEREVIHGLGEVVGHAIAALERKEALLTEEVLEVEFRMRNVLDTVGVAAPEEGTITFGHTVPIAEGRYLQYGTVTEGAVGTLEELVDRFSHFEEVTTFQTDGGKHRFELELVNPPVLEPIVSLGGRIPTAKVEGGDYQMVVHLPPGTDLRQVLELITDEYPDTELITKRRETREPTAPTDMEAVLADELTERQRTVLEAAYFSGFFEWPRHKTGEEIAESLGISLPTFSQHMRASERKLLQALFADKHEEYGEPGE